MYFMHLGLDVNNTLTREIKKFLVSKNMIDKSS